MYIKEGVVSSAQQIKDLNPNISFCDSTYAELGYAPYTPEPVPETAEQIKTRLVAAVQRHLDAEAQSRNYDNIVSACSYAAAPNAFQAEALTLLAWRSAVWQACYAVMAEVEAGTRAVPTEAELLAELPVPE